MDQRGYFESNREDIEEKKKIENNKIEQTRNVEEDPIPEFNVWKFTRSDAIVMVIGGILGGIFSTVVMRLL